MSNPSRQLRHARRPIIQEVAMRKITAGLFVSLDGVAEAHDGWHFPFLTEEWQRLIAARLPQADAVLLGRRTFVEFTRVWPPQGTDTPMAAFMNTTRKYVVSTTLDDVDALGWANSTLLTGDLVEELTRLMQHSGRCSTSLRTQLAGLRSYRTHIALDSGDAPDSTRAGGGTSAGRHAATVTRLSQSSPAKCSCRRTRSPGTVDARRRWLVCDWLTCSPGVHESQVRHRPSRLPPGPG